MSTPTDDNLAELRNSCEDRLAALKLPARCDIADLCARLSDQRGRPLVLIPIAMRAAQPCGLWVASDSADIVIFEARTTRPHQDHIIAHELAHIICGHRGSSSLADHAARLMFPDLNPELVRDMLSRLKYSDVQEREAEMVASLILTRQEGTTAVASTPALGALSGALGISHGRRVL
ncbi:toxin [Streptomyces anandii]|uniref:toxin n=1 Tax=Streptomyces anandii TaxID=285454 RepID=UPI0036AC17CB